MSVESTSMLRDSKSEASLVALACSDPPDGEACRTMQVLADRLMALEVVDRISDETVRRTLKKTTSSQGGAGTWSMSITPRAR